MYDSPILVAKGMVNNSTEDIVSREEPLMKLQTMIKPAVIPC